MLTVLLALARRRWLGQVARLGMEGPAYLRFAYMGAGLESGFFDIMRDRPGTAEELGRALGIAPGMESALDSWLDAGAAFGVLKESRGVYSLGKRAAAVARANIEKWGLSDRATVEVADIRSLQGDGSADLITLHQNIYYFADDEQADLLAHLRGFLAPGGRILITSVMRRSGAGSAALDMWGAFTEGAARLPIAAELEERLREAGFVDVACRRTSADGVYGMATGTAPTI